MNQFGPEKDYWVNYWTTSKMVENENPHCQVARTVNKIPIDQQRWKFHLHEIEQTLDLGPSDSLLDLCAGNGLITMPLSLRCKSVTAVDISSTLLEKIDTNTYPTISLITGDVRDVCLPESAFTKGLMYCALQHFNERETIGIFEAIYQSLMRGGSFLVGDIPDIDRLFVFYNKPEWVRAYFDSVKANTPAVGTWFKKEILLEMAKYVGFGDAKILSQHPNLINSHYRFDLSLKK